MFLKKNGHIRNDAVEINNEEEDEEEYHTICCMDNDDDHGHEESSKFLILSKHENCKHKVIFPNQQHGELIDMH